MNARPVGTLALDALDAHYSIATPASQPTRADALADMRALLARVAALEAALGRARVALTFYSTQMPEGKTYPYGLDAEERAVKLVPDAWGAMLAVGQKPDGESQEVKS